MAGSKGSSIFRFLKKFRREVGGDNGGKRGTVVKEYVERTHGQRKRGVGSRVGGGGGWGEEE